MIDNDTGSQKAAIYALLGRIFISELDHPSLEALQAPAVVSIFEKLHSGVQAYLQETEWDQAQIELLASDYCHLFILPQKSMLSLQARHWLTGDEAAKLTQLESIISSADFDALAINTAFDKLPKDHLGVLLYFVSSVYASDDPNIQKLGTSLIQIALLPWIIRFNEQLVLGSDNPLYLASGKLLLEVLDFEEQG